MWPNFSPDGKWLAFTADYQASYMGMQGAGKMTLVADGANRWKYSLSVSSPLANLRQTTVFEDTGGQWRPVSGNDSSQVLTKKQNKNATYDWSKGVATWTGDGLKVNAPSPVAHDLVIGGGYIRCYRQTLKRT